MPIAVPTITELIPPTYEDVTDLLDGLASHFESVSTKWNKVAITGDTGALVIQSIADPSFQIAFKQTASMTMNVEMHTDFVNGITHFAAGGGGVFTSDANDITPYGVFTYEGTNTHALRAIHISELDDAIFIMCVHTDNYWLNSIHAGRITAPEFPDAHVPLGRDGLGCLLNRPAETSNGSTSWWSVEGNTPAANRSVLHKAHNKWGAALIKVGVYTGSSPENADNVAAMGFVTPYACNARVHTLTYGNTSIGNYKYITSSGTNFAGITRADLDNATDQAWIKSGLSNVNLIWRRGYVP
jgi:hypothetical protein